ncbi:MAG: glycosyltransferase family 39 protein [Patescibacteria group bacterium]
MKQFLARHPHIVRIAAVSLIAGLGSTGFLVWVASAQGLNPAAITGDAKGYLLLADNLRTQQVFSVATSAPFYPESFRAPGYPFFLALLYTVTGSWLGTLFLQALLLSVAPVLLYLLIRPYHERAAFWGSIVYALEPLRLFYSASLLSDALFAALLLAALLCLQRARGSWRYAGATGFILGISILVRPIAVFLPFVFAGFALWSYRPLLQGVKIAGIIVVIAVLTVLPWSLRNYELFGSFNVSSVGAANLMLYNAPEFLKFNPAPEGRVVYERFKEEQEMLPREEALSLARTPIFTASFKEVIQGEELSYLFFHVFKTMPFFLSDGLRDVIRLFNVEIGTMPNITTDLLTGRVGNIISYLLGGGIAIWLFIIGITFWGITTLFWLWCVVQTLRGRMHYSWAFLGVLILYFALLTGPVSNARYRLPIEGFLIASAAAVVLKRHEA